MTTSHSANRTGVDHLAHGLLRAPLALLLTLALLIVGMPTPAGAVETAEFADGGAEDDGVRYAKQGDQLTLEVTTEPAECVQVRRDGAAVAEQRTSGNEREVTEWTFVLHAAAGDGPDALDVTSYSNRGCNQDADTSVASYMRDNTAPQVTGTPEDDNLGNDGWYTGDVTVSWDCTDDGGSGVEPGGCPGDTTVDGEGDGLSGQSPSVSDRVGNSATGSVSGIKIDRTAPLTTADAPDGWKSSDVTVSLDADDELSEVAATYYRLADEDDEDWETYDGSLHYEDEGWYELEFHSVDEAGNVENPKSVEFGIDKTAPTIETSQDPEANAAGWNNSDVTVSFVCGDDVSDFASCTEPLTVTDEVESHEVQGTAVDLAGNDNTASRSVSIDKTAPTVTDDAPDPDGNAGWHTSPVTVNYTCDDPFSNDVASGIPSGACPSAQTLSDDGEGQSADTVSVTDAAGNDSDDLTVAGIDIDQTDPETTATGVPGGWVNESVTVTLDAGDHGGSGVATIYYQIDHGTPEAYSDAIEFDADGEHSLTYWSTDVAGNIEESTTEQIRIDTAAPVSQVSLSETDWTNEPVTVTLSADDEEDGSGVDVIRYRLGDGDAQDYDDSFDIDSHGEQTLTFWSVDHAGNVEDEQTATLLIDTVKPTLTGEALDTNLGSVGWYVDDITVEWDCSDADSGIDGDCPDDTVVTDEGSDLKAAAHVYDNAGNRTDAEVDGLGLDRTAPTTQAAAPDGWQNDDVTVELTADDEVSGVAETTYRIDDGGEQTSAHTGDPVEVTFTEDGTYTLEFWSTDVAGNTEATNTVDVKVDQTAPTISSSQNREANGAGWNNTDVTVSFTCEDVTSGIASCTSDKTVSDEVEDHDVEGEAIDNAGNSATATHRLSIDKTAPEVSSSVDGPEGENGWFVGQVTVDFDCDDVESGGVASGIPAGTCPDDQTLSDDGSDQSTSSVTVSDRAGNESDSYVRDGIHIDQTPPQSSASGLPEDDWTNESVTVELTADDGDGSGVAETEYQIGDGDYEPYDGAIEFADEGSYTLHYRSIDNAGNDETANTAEIRIDKTAPDTDSSGLSGGDWTNESVTVELTPSDDRSGVATTYYQVGDGDEQVYDEPFELSDEGVHELTYWSVDNAGNVEGENAATVRIDKTAPVTTSDAPSGWQTETVTIELSPSDSGGSGIAETRYRIGDEASKVYDESFELGEGVHELAFWSTDAAGNEEEEGAATVRVDLSDPDLDVTSPADGSSTAETTTTVTGTAGDSLSGVEKVTVDGQEAQLDGGPDEFTFELAGVELACGPNTLTVVATNGAGRSDSDEVSVTRQCASVTGIDKPLKTSQQGDVNINDIRGNRVLPLKVELEYLDEAYTGSDASLGNPTIRLRELPGCDDKEGSEVADAESAGRANTDDEFRWSNGKWIYNLASSGLEGGTCYRVDVLLDGARASNGQWAVVRTN